MAIIQKHLDKERGKVCVQISDAKSGHSFRFVHNKDTIDVETLPAGTEAGPE